MTAAEQLVKEAREAEVRAFGAAESEMIPILSAMARDVMRRCPWTHVNQQFAPDGFCTLFAWCGKADRVHGEVRFHLEIHGVPNGCLRGDCRFVYSTAGRDINRCDLEREGRLLWTARLFVAAVAARQQYMETCARIGVKRGFCGI